MTKPIYKHRIREFHTPPQRKLVRGFGYYYGTGTWDSGPSVDQTTRGARVELSEVLSGWNGKRTEEHGVMHTKETLRLTPVSWSKGPDPTRPLPRTKSPRFSGGGRSEAYFNATQIMGTSVIPGTPVVNTPSLLDWRKCYEALLDDVHGLLPAQKAIAVNVAEFTQLRRLVPGIAASIKRLIRFMKREGNRKLIVTGRRRGFGYFRKAVSVSSGAWCLRDLSQLHLASQFGVLPLANDLADLAGKFHEAKLHLNWFRILSNGETHHVHSSVSARTSSEATVANSYYATMRDQSQSESRGTLYAAVRLEPESTEVVQRRLLNQILGMNVPLQIAWELVPFSFVLDWFLPVGEVLTRFEPKRYFGSLSARVTFLDRWHSVKSEAHRIRVVEKNNQSFENDIQLIGNVRCLTDGRADRSYTIYERQRGWPALNWMPPKGRFQLQQVGLSLALVVTRLIK